MCMGGSYDTPTTKVSDPTPTAVTTTETGADTSSSNKKLRKIKGASDNAVSTDRGTLGSSGTLLTGLSSKLGGGN